MGDVQTGQELRRFTGHTAGVENVAFSPDGKYILTGSDDGTARLWDVDYHTAIDYLCSRLLRDFTEEERAQYGILQIKYLLALQSKPPYCRHEHKPVRT